jgi:hypothetical protein
VVAVHPATKSPKIVAVCCVAIIVARSSPRAVAS